MHRDFLSLLLKTYKETGDEEQALALYDEMVQDEAFQTGTLNFSHSNVYSNTEITEIGRYKIHEVLGKGGMGTVWKVKDPILGRTVALKIINDSIVQDEQVLADFMEEIQISAQLQHPGIVPLYELHNRDGKTFFTMKEIKGQTLRQCIADVHRIGRATLGTITEEGWSLRRLLTVFHSICKTMAYAHSKGVVHRDLKPSNVMVGQYGEVLVVDWGIAIVAPTEKQKNDPDVVQTDRSLSKSPISDLIVGTPVYMSPEQAMGANEGITPKSDIYTLGMILFEILTGRPPYKGSVMEIISQKQQHYSITPKVLLDDECEETVRLNRMGSDMTITEADRLTIELVSAPPIQDDWSEDLFSAEEKKDIPVRLQQICGKAIQKVPQNRYDSAEDLALQIQLWLDGAEKTEKAQRLLSQVEVQEAQRKQHKERALQLWSQAEKSLEVSADSSEGWKYWNESRSLHDKAERLEFSMHLQLQNAMVYAPELTDIHRKLAHHEYQDFIFAYRNNDRRNKERAEERFRLHLEQLPGEEQNAWIQKKAQEMFSIDAWSRKRGVFVGRRALMQQILSKLIHTRLLTLVGTAGVGKTHLALQASMLWQQSSNSKTLFCDLSNAFCSMGIIQAFARALQLTLSPSAPWEQILDAIQAQEITLLVLDNVEQATSSTADALKLLFQKNSTLTAIITSRVKLGTKEEEIVVVHPMSTLEGIELFIAQAKKSHSHFEIDESNRFAIVQIVQDLDHLPLAIELAAARVAMLSVQQIAERLSQRFSLLKRSDSSKGRALLGALDWSWGLLPPFCKTIFAQLCVFQNGFDLVAAESIVELSVCPEAHTFIDMLEILCDVHLLRKDFDGTYRYSMLSSIQQYAHQKWSGSQEKELQQLRQKHARYYGQTYHQLHVAEDSQMYAYIHREFNNLLAGSIHGAGEDAFNCCAAVMHLFRNYGPLEQGIDTSSLFLKRENLEDAYRYPILIDRIACQRLMGKTTEAMKELEDAVDAITKRIKGTQKSLVLLPFHAALLKEKGDIEHAIGDIDSAFTSFRAASELYTVLGDKKGLIGCTERVGVVQAYKGDFRAALQTFREGLSHAIDAEYLFGQALLSSGAGIALSFLGEFEEATGMLEFSVDLLLKQNNRVNLAKTLSNLSLTYTRLGVHRLALQHYRLSLDAAQKTGDKRAQGSTLLNMGILYLGLEQYKESAEQIHASIKLFTDAGDQRGLGVALGNLGEVLFLMNQYTEAEDVLRRAIVICDAVYPTCSVMCRSILALTLGYLNRIEESISVMEEVESGQQGKFSEDLAFLCRKVQVLFLAGKKKQALEIYQELRAIIKKQGTLEAEVRNRLEETQELLGIRPKIDEGFQKRLAVLIRSSGAVTTEEFGILQEGCRLYQKEKNLLMIARTMIRIGQAHQAAKNINSARAFYKESRMIAIEEGFDVLIEQIESCLTSIVD